MNYKQEMYRKMYEKLGIPPELAPGDEYQEDMREEKKLGDEQRRFEFLAPKFSQAAAGLGTLGGQASRPLQDSAFDPMKEGRESELKAIESAGIKDNELKKYLAGKMFDRQKPEVTKYQEYNSPSEGGEALLYDPSTGAFKTGPKVQVKPDAGAKMPSMDKARLDNVNMALKALDSLDEEFKKDASTGVFRTMGNAMTVGDTGYDFAVNRWNEAIGRMQSGGAITDEEADNFRRMIPSLRDSPEIRAQKMATMRDEMYSRLTTLGQPPRSPAPQQAPQEKVVDGVRYRKVQGGWEAVE